MKRLWKTGLLGALYFSAACFVLMCVLAAQRNWAAFALPVVWLVGFATSTTRRIYALELELERARAAALKRNAELVALEERLLCDDDAVRVAALEELAKLEPCDPLYRAFYRGHHGR